MRSLLFFKILGWFGAMLLFSLVAFEVTTTLVLRANGPMDPFTLRMFRWQLSESVSAFETGGAPALAALLQKWDRTFGDEHYLVTGSGRDVITGEDRSALLVRRPRRWHLPFLRRPPVAVHEGTADGRYRLVIRAGHGHFNPPNLLPYYAWIVGVIVLLCWALAFNLVKPLRHLRETVLKFGVGDLAARTNSTRRDELGEVSRAFDDMAARIQKLLTSERRLLQDISHELRSPLARLNFAVELARTAGDRQAALDRIKKHAEQISGLVGELIESMQADGDMEERAPVPVDLAELAGAVVDDSLLEADARKCTIVRRIDAPAVVAGDARLLRRAVENVMRNAILHSPEGEPVEVSLNRENGAVVLAIRDHGPGVPGHMLDDIFRPFFRVDDDRARSSGGVGLGLAIAQRAVHLHHGQIGAENMNPGLRVAIRLPVYKT